MPLTLVATPIGNPDDLGSRALECLRQADILIGEEHKVTRRLLSQYKIPQKEIRLLNEHTEPDEVQDLAKLCEINNVVLVSDCGTPNFCDPGYQLVKLCRNKKIAVTSVPGASSLMVLLSMVGQRLHSFYFRGFLPAKSEQRKSEWKKLIACKEPIILLDTPYRLHKTLEETMRHFPSRKVLLGLNLTQKDESYIECRADKLPLGKIPKKAEFILLVYS